MLRGARLDLTESNLYSIAPGTQRIVSSLKEPVNLYFFFSQEASSQSPPLRAYAQRVRELLEEMARALEGQAAPDRDRSRSRSRKTRTAPPSSACRRCPLGARGESLYFGLAGTNSTDGREIIGFFQPDKEEFLEYDVASLIHRLGNPKRPTVGLMSGAAGRCSLRSDDRADAPRLGEHRAVARAASAAHVATDVAAIDRRTSTC